MKTIFYFFLILFSPILLVACSDDNEPIGDGSQYEYVDLGLPSGTLWATMNVGAKSPEEFGDFFAWGETSTKKKYDLSTYKWNKKNKMSKYCVDKEHGTVDNKTELDVVDDAAYVNWGTSWRIPTSKQISELQTECTWQWTTRNGVNGYLVTSKHNSNSLFLPAAGYRLDADLSSKGVLGSYWSRNLDTDNSSRAHGMEFVMGSYGWIIIGREEGLSVRAVRLY